MICHRHVLQLRPGDKLFLLSSTTSVEHKWGFTVRLSIPAAAPDEPGGPRGGPLELQKETPPSAKRLRSAGVQHRQSLRSNGSEHPVGGDSPPQPPPGDRAPRKKNDCGAGAAAAPAAPVAPRTAPSDDIKELMFSGAVVVMHRQSHAAALRRRLEALGARVMRSDEVQEDKGPHGWGAVSRLGAAAADERHRES